MEMVFYVVASFTVVILFLKLLCEIGDHSITTDNYKRSVAKMQDMLDEVQSERDALKCELGHANQSIADITADLSTASYQLEKVAKERDELQAKVCELKTNDIELLNLKIYKERVLTRLKSIIDDEVDE